MSTNHPVPWRVRDADETRCVNVVEIEDAAGDVVVTVNDENVDDDPTPEMIETANRIVAAVNAVENPSP